MGINPQLQILQSKVSKHKNENKPFEEIKKY